MEISELFCSHPRAVGETYFGHLKPASMFEILLLLASMVTFIHALFPFLLVTTASRLVTRLHHIMVINRAKKI
jgi:hypothetical protein